MIITISRQFGSEGDQIAALVAAELRLTLVDRPYMRRAAREAGIAEDLLSRLFDEGQRGMAAEIVENLGAQRMPDRISAPSASPLLNVFAPILAPRMMTLEDAAKGVGALIQHVAKQDNLLVLGMAGQSILQQAKACHVQIVAPFETRAARVAQRENASLVAARRKVRASDDARATYVARFYGARWQDPLLYHLVINTGELPVAVAVSLICHAAHQCA